MLTSCSRLSIHGGIRDSRRSKSPLYQRDVENIYTRDLGISLDQCQSPVSVALDHHERVNASEIVYSNNFDMYGDEMRD